jgi:hypothetical protein
MSDDPADPANAPVVSDDWWLAIHTPAGPQSGDPYDPLQTIPSPAWWLAIHGPP